MNLTEQFKNLLNESFVSNKERNEWLDLIPEIEEDELKKLISLLLQRKEVAEIKNIGATQALQQNPVEPNISIEKISQWGIIQINDRAIFAKLKILSEGIIKNEEIGEGADLFRTLKDLLSKNPKFKEENHALAREYDVLIARLAYLALSSIEDKDVDELFKNFLLLGLNSEDVDIKKRMDLRSMLYHDEVNDGAERKRILRAIKENVETIGKEKIEISGEEKLVSPTVKNWLRDYELSFEERKVRTTVEAVTYLNQNKNARKLTKEDKELLLKVLSFYDSLMFSGAVEEVKARDVQRSVARSVKNEAPNISPEDIEKKYQDNLGDEEKVKKVEEEILIIIKNNGTKIEDLIYEEISPKDTTKIFNKEKIIAGLRVVAGLGELGKLLNDNRFSDLVKKYLNQKNLSQTVNGFEINPTDPKYLVSLLRYILEYLLKLNEEKSAGIGIQLVNLMKKGGENKYNSIVYFDEEKGGFVWEE
ncbi:hypothetical protein A2316_01825 [Candidatus Falkowbacteria bacterium RIFOXYB2_FULL_38_15]|uniref:Uncharacterized protein n=1 Tax=Candidatus Falkowbacteria bacterium RIFOXYA2_FULL_38_12 TaxID=1797993 RepID=A0A1F5S2C8_9BACT|nr:MAG: hypothetical protein A2257_03605 [Candidatus Falkowbacteria bacterium RIFOXYA2_FULL_38_12]OGF32690.1 MAG: hypothetical protein A2316_01825 [Candidatus Falkowbacteria bacterium RIFOXYB2_FULL_38_15]OGF42094.1 MAG: hypothetical protein A2555_01720 [Candidatus Falkowbacteria bacterium RIFOXYD2_FULL_39_16]